MFWDRRRMLRTRKKRDADRKKFLHICAGSAILLLILAGVLAYGSHRPEVTIKEISFNGLSTLPEREIRPSVEEHLEGSYMYLFSKKNIALYPDDSIAASVLAAHKKVKEIELVRDSFTTLSIDITEREPYALWCGNKEEENNQQCYFIDEEGLIYAEAPNFTGSIFFIFYGYLDNEEPIGTQYIDTETFNQLQLFVDLVRDTPLVPIALGLVDQHDAEIYLEQGGKIIFSYDKDFAQMFQNLQTVLLTEQFQDEELVIDHIDLRFGNKVYYTVE